MTRDSWTRRFARAAAHQLDVGRHLLKWATLGVLVGSLAGGAAFVFLEVLDRVTRLREQQGRLIWLLPVIGMVIGLAYHHVGGRASGGSSLLLDEIHDPSEWVPRRMAPLVLFGTWATHLVGGSAGREGTGVQMGGSLADSVSRLMRFGTDDRRRMLVAGLAGGFGAVFGVPAAGMVFALEVQGSGRLQHEAIVPALAASATGDLVVRGLGRHHGFQVVIDAPVHTAWLDLRVAVAAIGFGLLAALFIESTHAVSGTMARVVAYPPLRPALGGGMLLALIPLVGRDALGLSLPLYDRAITGAAVAAGMFALKLVLTALTLGSGFPGGEVTPLLVMGATLGSTLAPLLGLPRPLLAAVGSVAVLAAAANVPVAGLVMGVELFGSSVVVQLAIACVVAYLCSGHRGVYEAQRLFASKDGGPPPAGRRLRARGR